MSKLKQGTTTPIRGLGAAKTRPHARRNNANDGSGLGRSTPANASTSSPVTASAEPAVPRTPGNSLNISKPKYDPEHPAAHLREHQFKPGESGNPSGRPKGIFGAAALRRLLRAGKEGESKLVEVIDAQIDKAIRKHSTQAAGFLRDCVDGKPATRRGKLYRLSECAIERRNAVGAATCAYRHRGGNAAE